MTLPGRDPLDVRHEAALAAAAGYAEGRLQCLRDEVAALRDVVEQQGRHIEALTLENRRLMERARA